MKRLLLLFTLIILVGFFTFKFAKDQVRKDLARPVPYPTTVITPTSPAVTHVIGPEKQSLFVPYWAVKGKIDDATQYNSYIYFGVATTTNGLDMREAGGVALDAFAASVPQDGKKLLVVRMIDKDTNFAILKDEAAQLKIIAQTISLAKEKKFDGVVLDLEVSAIPFDSLVQQINSFTKLFYQEVKRNNLSFSLTVYGDVFYRLRPFDVKVLSKNADQVMVMAYDFSKAKGNPGPNFPLQGKDVYGYDYEEMIDDFLRVVPAEKLTVIFGLFGYDWLVDGRGQTLQQGKAVTTQAAESQFIEICKQKSCSFSRDSKAFETQINYVAKDGSKHIIWFEDMQSVEAKKEFLKSRGINSFSYWAYSYF